MRVISGSLKGRSIKVPKNFGGRPTTDFAREGLFNVLNNLVEWDELDILDLFAGTGAFGIECSSRGAGSITFVEIKPLHVNFILDNIKHFGMKQSVALKYDVFKFLEKESKSFDVIFADPPYDLAELSSLPKLIFEGTILNEDGIFILEHGREYDFSGNDCFLQHRVYSNVHFSFFQRK